MPASLAEVSFAILAGGAGVGLGGVAKGLLSRDGRPLLAHLLQLGRGFRETLLVGSALEPYAEVLRAHPAVRPTPDLHPGKGAPGGLHAALAAAAGAAVLVVAADMPFVTAEVAGGLVGRWRASDAALCWEVGGRVQPLPGLYARSAAARVQALLPEDPSLKTILAALSVRLLPEDDLRRLDADLSAVVSINLPEDLTKYGVALP